MLNAPLEEIDPELNNIIEHEKNRQWKVCPGAWSESTRAPARRVLHHTGGMEKQSMMNSRAMRNKAKSVGCAACPLVPGPGAHPFGELHVLSVMQAVGSVMTNKYSEGYPGARYYGGNE